MHRSGTSLVAKVLSLFGVCLGPQDDLLEPRFDNPRGYWEQRPIMDINDAIFEALGGSWSQPPQMPTGWTELPEIEAIATRAREVVRAQFADSALWAWKDPRTSITLPFWRAVVPEARWIVCMRSPVDVAASLQRRDPSTFPWDAAVGLWLRHSAEALEHTEPEERLILFYEDWFVEREVQLERLARFIGRESSDPAVREGIDGCIEADLRHHRSSALEVAQLAGLSSEARVFYLSLRAAHVVGMVIETGRADLAAAVEPNLAEAIELVTPRLRYGMATRDQLARLRQAHEDAMNQAHAERDRLVAVAERDRDKAVVDSQRTRDAATSAAAARQSALDRAQRELEQTRQRLEEARGTVARQDRKLVHAQAFLERERARKQRLLDSTSWRLTRPLRAGKDGLVALRRGRLAKKSTAAQKALSHASEPPAEREDRPPPTGRSVQARDRAPDRARALFDVNYYSAQSGVEFESEDEALNHYLEKGYSEGFDPHPLFYGRWYAGQHSGVVAEHQNPLLAFLEEGVAGEHDPNPYFDTAFYYSQRPALRAQGENALSHYIETAATSRAANPNPLFVNGFYLSNHPQARTTAGTPLEHFLTTGWRERSATSAVHHSILSELRKTSSALWRGRWRKDRVVLFTAGDRHDSQADLFALADRLSSTYHFGCVVIALRRASSSHSQMRALVLEDFEGACPDIYRASALKLLTYSVTALRPALAISDTAEVVEAFHANGVGTYFLLPEANRVAQTARLEEAVDRARRTLVPSSEAFYAAQQVLGHHPANAALCRAPHSNGASAVSLEDYAESMVGFAVRDFGLNTPEPSRRTGALAKIIVPCSDWSVSGVNASLETLGLELIARGWEVEVLFTRNQNSVLESAGGEDNMPKLPYRYLFRDEPGVLGMWEALIADLEARAPCILFTGYDFVANGVASALTDKVGAVAWVQSADGDYYEQAYRLGRYCNAVVCVSHHIADQVSALNPAIGAITHVIHNASVRGREILAGNPQRAATLRLIYTGRLVQYQKRVLDFVELARALERTQVPFEISLVGTFPAREEKTKRTFEERARPYLEDGRISLLGRKSRDELFAELTHHDFFVLLSDFEGLPLSLVEAMARGCVPVAAESPSGVPEVITSGDNGFLVGGRDYDAWAQLLVQSWQDREMLAQMSERARATVRDRFTAERVAGRFDALFRSVAEQIESGTYRRPDSLHWGEDRSGTGDVLAPPNLQRPNVVHMAGLR